MTSKELRNARMSILKRMLKQEETSKKASSDAFEIKEIEKRMKLITDWITELLWVESATGGSRV